ncbi:MAG: family transporter [Clostridiales bacterium]|nr:family transporter [Clostridiales bacterium]
MKLDTIISQIVVLFLIMIIGFFARRKNIINNEVNKGLTEFLLNISLPFLIITSFNFDFSIGKLQKSVGILFYSLCIFIISYFIGRVLYAKYPKDIKSVLIFSAMFSNCGFMGFPIVESIYGKEGVFYAAIFNMPFNILIWTVGISLYSGKKDLSTIKKALLNPGTLAVYIGLFIFLFSIKIPGPVFKTLEMVGGMTSPLSMIVIGAMLGGMNVKEVFSSFSAYYSTFVRLILVPFVVFVILKLIGARGMDLGVLVLISAMPIAANTAIMSEKHGGDSGLASKCIFISTVLSTITIPIVIMLIL